MLFNNFLESFDVSASLPASYTQGIKDGYRSSTVQGIQSNQRDIPRRSMTSQRRT
jgi:hypothetical protein